MNYKKMWYLYRNYFFFIIINSRPQLIILRHKGTEFCLILNGSSLLADYDLLFSLNFSLYFFD